MKFEKQFDRRKVIAGLLIGAGAVLVYCILSNLDAVGALLRRLLGYMAPVSFGLLLAYLMRPLAKRIESLSGHLIKSEKARIHIGAISTFIVLLVLVIVVIWMILPQLLYSASSFVSNIDRYLASVQELVEKYSAELGIENPMAELYDGTGDQLVQKISKWLTENFAQVMSAVLNLGSYAMNFIIALMIALYALLDRKNLKRSALRVEKAVMGESLATRINDIVYRGDHLTMKFLTSNLLDALIIGVVNFVFLTLLNAPYPLLLSVLLGVTNFIPTFGPIIGGVLAGVILLITEPGLVIVFAIFTLVLQQIDGNVIKPLLFGDSTGLSPFWVLVAIVVGGRMFSVLGMILGVPVVALCRSVLTEVIDRRIARKAAVTAAEEAENAPVEAPESPDEEGIL